MNIDNANAYGYALLAFGFVTAAFFWFVIGNVPMTALGIGLVVIGSSIAITTPSPIPSATVRKLLESSILNIESLLEELDINRKGYYVPKEDGGVQVYVPLDPKEETVPPFNAKMDGFLTRVDGKPYMIIFPPGSFLLKNATIEDNLERMLSENIVDVTGLADSIKAVDGGTRIIIEVNSPKIRTSAGRVRNTLGSLEASIAATIVAAARKKVVSVESEEENAKNKKIILSLI